MSIREDVCEDVLKRIAEEHGVETMVLDWAILDKILEEGLSPPENTEEDSE